MGYNLHKFFLDSKLGKYELILLRLFFFIKPFLSSNRLSIFMKVVLKNLNYFDVEMVGTLLETIS